VSGHIVVTTTAGSPGEAEALAQVLLEARLAACVQLGQVSSRYLWQGEIVRDNETLLTIKTRADLFEAVVAAIRERHSYENPEIIAVPVIAGSDAYLTWIDDNTGSPLK
jgi:periplasmic divalent cation tolerance protein